MFEYLLKRLSVSLLVVLGSMTIVFIIVNVLPGDIAQMLLGDTISTEKANELSSNLGLDRPLAVQYWDYITDVLQGNLGSSYVNQSSVQHTLLINLPSTIELTLTSSLIAVIVGILMGIAAAVYRDSWIDSVIRIISLFGVCTPTFWIGLLLIFVFSVHLHWFPAIGSGGLSHLVLPSVGLGLSGAGMLARLVRNSMLEVLHKPFVRTLRAKGIRESTIIFKHMLRNAVIPAVTMAGMIIGEMLAGSVVTETVFSRQGIGKIIVDAINAKDIPMIQGAVLLTSVFYILINLLADISYMYIDPRIRKMLRPSTQ
ncbi:peptide/nickel transport system permease protein [Paenibacillus cellulosilyticus]|uniref:Peptide/nickel transport system permease protein n=1 Tax=Paenibacillus cellulosilyticus TaxID=375489 RepID=A0A2V2YVZ3_9BACL|nr:ABC transporter permease [Paenibacillus cellulosilyticus]PWW02786.1 peptide/nickel transport system permease protein [Paenibacillus cellulosilyticus]QKS45709.1 ABC transporter permease [Paenibacillus cellulosilyticus]